MPVVIDVRQPTEKAKRRATSFTSMWNVRAFFFLIFQFHRFPCNNEWVFVYEENSWILVFVINWLWQKKFQQERNCFCRLTRYHQLMNCRIFCEIMDGWKRCDHLKIVIRKVTVAACLQFQHKNVKVYFWRGTWTGTLTRKIKFRQFL